MPGPSVFPSGEPGVSGDFWVFTSRLLPSAFFLCISWFHSFLYISSSNPPQRVTGQLSFQNGVFSWAEISRQVTYMSLGNL